MVTWFLWWQQTGEKWRVFVGVCWGNVLSPSGCRPHLHLCACAVATIEGQDRLTRTVAGTIPGDFPNPLMV
jgi:hypothetical protein